MGLLRTSSINFKLKALMLLLFAGCHVLKSSAQDFKWAYTPVTVNNEENKLVRSHIFKLVTNNDKEIYAMGRHEGEHDFGDGQQGMIYESSYSAADFIVKLDENKNVLWVKQFDFGNRNTSFGAIVFADNGDVFISGTATPTLTSLYLNPNPSNPAFPKVYAPTQENLTQGRFYGFIIKLDAQGNYINSIIFPDIALGGMTKDHNNNFIAGGSSLFDIIYPARKWGHIVKFDQNLNMLWERHFDNQNSGSDNGFMSIACDSQNNIYCSGSYRKNFAFGNTVLQQNLSDAPDTSSFVCKLSPGGTEGWIVELSDYYVHDLMADASGQLYFLASYFNGVSVQFANTATGNLPVIDNKELVLFKIDGNSNLIWHFPICGLEAQQAYGFGINNFGEVIVPVDSNRNSVLHYADQSTTIATGTALTTLIKIKPNGDLANFKHLYDSPATDEVASYAICTDTDGDIILGGYFWGAIDFDPSLYEEHIVTPSTFLGTINEIEQTIDEVVGFILKLENCDALPLYDDHYDFCSGETPNPTIADIEQLGPNISWYATSVSPTKLNAGFPLVDGQTYYYENPVENCSDLGRFPLQIRILPASPPPVIVGSQPCYFQGMRLSDVNISGQNLLFYTADTAEIIPSATLIVAGINYYVSQKVGPCESAKVPVTFSDNSGSGVTEYAIGFCNDGSNRRIDFSDYNVHFLPNGTSQSDYTFSYHHSYDDANDNINPIGNSHNYPINQQTIYVRIFSSQSSCFRVVTLKIELFSPPVIDEVQIVDLAENNSITILPFEANYTYSLDGMTFQSNNYFENVSSGEYNLYIKNGDCPGAPKTVYVLDYPKFFTPNGDGTNDNWKVKYSQFQISFNIEIYDRYGKVIAVIDKTSAGWDGTYQGRKLPADDYWFRIIRVTDKEIIYRGHFALKR